MTPEPEYKILQDFVRPGDWVVDIGANVGHYTKRLSELVGPRGRVIAFEPVPATFRILSANAALFAYPNVSLINAAASDTLSVVGMSVPKSSGVSNYYEAHLSSPAHSEFSVLAIPLDSLSIAQHVSLVKIDAEGHEPSVLSGMRQLVEMHHPVLFVEGAGEEIIANLASSGYVHEKLRNSPNAIFKPAVTKS